MELQFQHQSFRPQSRKKARVSGGKRLVLRAEASAETSMRCCETLYLSGLWIFFLYNHGSGWTEREALESQKMGMSGNPSAKKPGGPSVGNRAGAGRWRRKHPRPPPAYHTSAISPSDSQPGAPQGSWCTCFWGAWRTGLFSPGKRW